jgi:hypothetical protein
MSDSQMQYGERTFAVRFYGLKMTLTFLVVFVSWPLAILMPLAMITQVNVMLFLIWAGAWSNVLVVAVQAVLAVGIPWALLITFRRWRKGMVAREYPAGRPTGPGLGALIALNLGVAAATSAARSTNRTLASPPRRGRPSGSGRKSPMNNKTTNGSVIQHHNGYWRGTKWVKGHSRKYKW